MGGNRRERYIVGVFHTFRLRPFKAIHRGANMVKWSVTQFMQHVAFGRVTSCALVRHTTNFNEGLQVERVIFYFRDRGVTLLLQTGR